MQYNLEGVNFESANLKDAIFSGNSIQLFTLDEKQKRI
jgi:uncharacterized protein YjbI with pentapeptide repeats